jgi:serine protease Do
MSMCFLVRSGAAACAVLALALAQMPIAGAQARAGLLPDFTELYERNGPTVVSIDVTQRGRRARGGMPELSEDDPFYEFFRRFGQVPPPGRGPQREPEAQSVGSGFVIGADGFVITNAHVVDGADEVTVKLSDKREFKAKVVGADKRTDIALLKIEAMNLTKVTIGDPDKLRVGEWVVAIGKPFGLENTMTAGIVSAKGRDLPQENLVPFIQTDVAINPGNSGGPLFNMKGEVVGINSLIYSRTGGYMGLAFAIPIDVAMNTVNQIKEKGRVTRGRIGVQIQAVSKEEAEAFGLGAPRGALVNGVERDGPAAKAGVEVGDIIVKADGRDVKTSNELPRIISAVRPGTKIVLTVWRKGAHKEIGVTVAEMKEEAVAQPRRGSPAPKEKAKPNRMGLVLSDLTDEQKKEADVKAGVLVEDIAPTVRGNIQAGDVIVAIVSRGVSTEARSAAQVNELLSKVEKGTSVTLQLKRGETQFFSTLKAVNGE